MSGFAGSTHHWPGNLKYECQGKNGCCNGFFRLEQITTTGPLVSSLDHDIHPIFAEETLNGLLVGDIEVAFRLASLLIEASLPFWHSLISGDLVRTGPNDNGGADFDLCEEVRELQDMDEAPRSDTRMHLSELAGYIRFALNTEDPDINDTVKEGRIIDSDLFKGYCSTIYLGKERIDELDEATTGDHHLLNLLLLARDLCHELSHAVLYARWPEATGDHDYTFFEDVDVAEEGLVWEHRTFGGILRKMTRPAHVDTNGTMTNSETDMYEVNAEPSTLGANMICMTQWPNLEKVREYQENSWPLGVRAAAKVPDPYMIWNVPFGLVAKLFRKKFWEQECISGRHDALHMPLTTGYRYRYSGPDEPRFRGVPADECEENVPGGYGIEEEGGLVLPFVRELGNVVQ